MTSISECKALIESDARGLSRQQRADIVGALKAFQKSGAELPAFVLLGADTWAEISTQGMCSAAQPHLSLVEVKTLIKAMDMRPGFVRLSAQEPWVYAFNRVVLDFAKHRGTSLNWLVTRCWATHMDECRASSSTKPDLAKSVLSKCDGLGWRFCRFEVAVRWCCSRKAESSAERGAGLLAQIELQDDDDYFKYIAGRAEAGTLPFTGFLRGRKTP